MKLHNPQVLGTCVLDQDPVADMEAVPKRYLLNMIQRTVSITDIVPTASGIVGLKTYEPDTVPANAVIQTAVANTANVRVHFEAEAERGQLFKLSATVNGVPAVLSRLPNGSIGGYADLTLDGDILEHEITVETSAGGLDICELNLLIGGPVVQSLVIGTLPNSQTAIKAGDVVPFTGAVRNDAQSMAVVAYGAAASGSIVVGDEDSASAGYRTFAGTFVASSASGNQSLRVNGTNILGTVGDNFDSAVIPMDQVAPTIATISVSYPVTQSAIKDNESATITAAVTGASSVAYSSAAGLSIADPSVYAASKTVTRTDETIGYQNSGTNVTITAYKASNGTQAVRTGLVRVADAAPTAAISISGNPTRLRSGQTYTVTVTPSQALAGAPSSLQASAGTFIGGWTPSGNNYTIQFQIGDSDANGAQVFSNLQITGLAGVQGNAITAGAAFTIGGLAVRDIVFPQLQRFAPIGKSIVDIAKTRAYYKGADQLALQNSTANVVKGYTIVDSDGNYSPTGDHLMISDVAFAGSNTSGTLTLTIEELV